MIAPPPPLADVAAAVGLSLDAAGDATAAPAGSPWYVRLLVGGVAWLAALSVIGFLAATGLIDEDTFVPWGVAIGGAAIALARRLPRDGGGGAAAEFGAQIALVGSLLARVMVVIGLGDWTDGNWAVIGLVMAALELAFLVLYPDDLERFVAAGLVGAWLLLALGDLDDVLAAAALRDVVTLAAAVAAGAIWLWRPRLLTGRWAEHVAPVGYGLTAFVLAACLQDTVALFGDWLPGLRWLLAGGLAAGLLGVLWVVRARLGQREIDMGAAVLAAIVLGVAGATWPEPGIVAAIGVLVLAFGARDGWLLGLGVVGLAATLWHYVYGMAATMLEKSTLLVAAGLVLLAGRWLWRRLRAAGTAVGAGDAVDGAAGGVA